MMAVRRNDDAEAQGPGSGRRCRKPQRYLLIYCWPTAAAP
jgi:hypothetical protein